MAQLHRHRADPSTYPLCLQHNVEGIVVEGIVEGIVQGITITTFWSLLIQTRILVLVQGIFRMRGIHL